MKQQRTDLQPFNMARLEEIRKIRDGRCCGRSNWLFWDELEAVLTSGDYIESNEWERLDNDEVVLGEVWSQPIGDFNYPNTVHRFTYLYVESQELAIAEHGHEEPVHEGKQFRKIKEWYVFPDGKMVLCKKDEQHKLENGYGKNDNIKVTKKGNIKITNNGYFFDEIN